MVNAGKWWRVLDGVKRNMIKSYFTATIKNEK